VAFLAFPAFYRLHRLPNAVLITACQAKLANKYTILDPFQGFREPVCLHIRCAYKLQQNMLLSHLLIDLFITDVDMPRIYGLKGIEHGQPGVLAVRINKRRCFL